MRSFCVQVNLIKFLCIVTSTVIGGLPLRSQIVVGEELPLAQVEQIDAKPLSVETFASRSSPEASGGAIAPSREEDNTKTPKDLPQPVIPLVASEQDIVETFTTKDKSTEDTKTIIEGTENLNQPVIPPIATEQDTAETLTTTDKSTAQANELTDKSTEGTKTPYEGTEGKPKLDFFTNPQMRFEPYTPEDLAGLSENFLIPQVFGGINISSLNNLQFAPFPKPKKTALQPTPIVIEQIDQLIQNALIGTSRGYPWIVNSSDTLSFAPLLFKPKQDSTYFNIDLRWSEDNPVINQITFGVFPHKDQFYWVLDNNRVVIETLGPQGGLIYQALERDFTFRQTLTQTQSFSGYQAVWVIPNDLQRLFKVEDLKDYTIISIGGSLTNPEGTTAKPVIINSGIDYNDENVIVLPNSSSFVVNPSTGSTNSPQGGGSLFGNLEVENSPLILQGFPTTDLSPLAEVDLKEGSLIPKDVLARAGISWGNIFTGEPATFTAPVTSISGIKVGQIGKFDNQDLLNILVNPFLTNRQRDRYYLNSLLWVPLGVREPEVNTILDQEKSKTYDWYRLYLSVSHNRLILQYDPERTRASYASVFSNPGVSLSFAYNDDSWDDTSSINATIGMAMGLVFEFINTHELNEALDEAKDKRDNGNIFAPLETQMSPQQRKAINQRLNSTLAYATLGSGLNQVSGYISFPSIITPEASSLFQIKTGNIRRAVQFLEADTGDWLEGDTFIAEARLSNRTFGPLTFFGSPLPIPPIAVRSNESSAAEIILLGPDGRKFIKRFNSNDLTTVPIGIRIFDQAFDRLVLQRIDTREVTQKYYNGYLYLPTVEAVYAGSDRDLTYSLNTGIWFNVDPNSAGNVDFNNSGLQEPAVGVYTNATLAATTTNFFLTPENKIAGIITQIPSFRFNWNSANNGNNPWQVSLSHTTFYQTANSDYSLTGSLAYISQYSNGPVIGLFAGKMGFDSGTNVSFNLELGGQIYYTVNLLQEIIPNLSIGPYVSNYTDVNFGFNSRILGLNYGGIIQHKFPDSPVTFSAQFGTGENGFEAKVKGGYRF